VARRRANRFSKSLPPWLASAGLPGSRVWEAVLVGAFLWSALWKVAHWAEYVHITTVHLKALRLAAAMQRPAVVLVFAVEVAVGVALLLRLWPVRIARIAMLYVCGLTVVHVLARAGEPHLACGCGLPLKGLGTSGYAIRNGILVLAGMMVQEGK